MDAAVYGIPFDTATTYRTGTRFGPEAIRSASVLLRPYNPALEVNVVETFSIVDYGDVPVSISWHGDSEVPGKLEALSQSVLGESLRNAVRHAEPSAIEICVTLSADTFSLEVVNDGVEQQSSGTGMGLRLASLEALQAGGVVEFGASERDRWRTRLVVPL